MKQIANIRFAIDSLNEQMTAVTAPLAALVGEGGLQILESQVPSIRLVRAKIAFGRLDTIRNALLTLRRDAAFWDSITALLDAPVEAPVSVEVQNGPHEPPLPAA